MKPRGRSLNSMNYIYIYYISKLLPLPDKNEFASRGQWIVEFGENWRTDTYVRENDKL